MSVPCRGHLGGVFNTPLQTGLRPSTPSSASVPYRGHLWGVCNTPLQTGLRPPPLFSFSFLDERKGGKRKSRRQGRQPNLPGTGRGCQGHRPNQAHPPHLPWPRQRPCSSSAFFSSIKRRKEGTRRPVSVPCRGHLGGVCFCALQTGLRPSHSFSFSFLDAPKYIGRNGLFFR